MNTATTGLLLSAGAQEKGIRWGDDYGRLTRNTKALIRLRAIATRRGDLIAIICLSQRIRTALEPFGPRAA